MKQVLLAAGAMLVAITGQPANAADPGTINCILDALDESTHQALLTHAQNIVQEKSGGQLNDQANVRFGAAADTCAKQFGWSEKARTAAIFYTFVKSGVPAYEAGVRADGFDVVAVEKVIRALPPAQFAGLSANPMPPDATSALVAGLTQAKIGMETEKQGFHVGVLAAGISAIEQKKAEFAAS